MFPNAKPSEQVAIVGAINPSSQAAGTASTGWVSVADYHSLLAVIATGVLGASATIDAKFQQATDSSGTGAKDIAGTSITQLVKANDDNVQAEINLLPEQLDVEGGYGYVRLQVTVGTAASLTGALLLGFVPRYAPPANAASVVQVI